MTSQLFTSSGSRAAVMNELLFFDTFSHEVSEVSEGEGRQRWEEPAGREREGKGAGSKGDMDVMYIVAGTIDRQTDRQAGG